jgi:hypothetical protein
MARACRDDLPDGESGIFLQPKLDRANRLEMIAENYAHARQPAATKLSDCKEWRGTEHAEHPVRWLSSPVGSRIGG